MNKNKLFTGFILIIIGILLFLANLGYINFAVLFSIFDIWPLLLVVAGVNILFKNKPIVSYITWILFFIVLIVYGSFYKGGIVSSRIISRDMDVKKPIETAYGELNLDIGAAKINLDSENESLLTAHLKGKELDYEENYKNNKEKAVLSFESKDFSASNLNNDISDYNFNLNKDVLWDIDLDLGAISGQLNLEEIAVKSIDLDFGAGNLDIILGNKQDRSNIKIDSGASNLTIVIPEEAGLKIKLDTALTKTNIDDLNLNKSGDYYISPNYEDASAKLDFEIDMAAGKIDFETK